jgi:hypothetical protein
LESGLPFFVADVVSMRSWSVLVVAVGCTMGISPLLYQWWFLTEEGEGVGRMSEI